MKRYILIITAIAGCAFFTSCEEDYMELTNPKVEEVPQVYSDYKIDWVAAADSCSAAFVERFYCSESRNGAEGVFSYYDYNSRGDNSSNYWQQAHAMAVMVDYYNRIRTTDPDKAAEIERYFLRWYEKKGNNWEGNQEYRGEYGFGNNYTDDTCWIIIALLQMYDATGNILYYNAAKYTWDECVWPRFPLNKYGYLPWKWDDHRAISCTNGPASIAASLLAGYAREAGDMGAYESYLEMACKCFDQNIDAMSSDGTLDSVPLSYTQGACIEAGRLIWKLTGELGYLSKAILAARGQMKSGNMNTEYNGQKVMRDEGADENNSIFKAVFFHWAARMIADTDIDSFDPRIRKELYDYVNRHASDYWPIGIEKEEGRWENSYFSTVCYQPRSVSLGGSLGAFASAAQAIEAMCLVRKTKFSDKTESELRQNSTDSMNPVRLYLPRMNCPITVSHERDTKFEWETCKNGNVIYQVVFDTIDGDFSNPIFIQSSDASGFKPKATLTSKVCDAIALAAGAAPGETVEVKWTVKTFKGLESKLGVEQGDQHRTIRIRRAE